MKRKTKIELGVLGGLCLILAGGVFYIRNIALPNYQKWEQIEGIYLDKNNNGRLDNGDVTIKIYETHGRAAWEETVMVDDRKNEGRIEKVFIVNDDGMGHQYDRPKRVGWYPTSLMPQDYRKMINKIESEEAPERKQGPADSRFSG